MPENISVEPKLFAGSKEELNADSETMARINRLISLQRSISRRPGVYFQAFTELGEDATAETLDIHDDAVETRSATTDPKKRIKEYFSKRDDKELQLDEDSDNAIFGTKEFRRLSQISQDKKLSHKKAGQIKTVIEAHPEAREASNAVRRYIFGQYVGRVVLWEAQRAPKKMKQAV